MSSRDSIAFRIERLVAVALLGLTSAFVNDALAGAAPQEPTVILDTTAVPPTGKTIPVAAGGDLQGALNSAQPGDVVELAAGATFTGNFVVPAKSGADSTHWVLIRSSAFASLPAAGTRVAPSNASSMAKIQTSNTLATLAFAHGAKFYRLQGIEITTTWSVRTATQYGLVTLGMGSDANTNATTMADLPTDVVFDRCYVHGTPTGNVRRGILINSARTAVIDSYISDIHEVGADTQAVGAWNGAGPFAIVNNYLEAAGENVMFGGADPSIPNLVASDIEIRNNLFSKPLSWKSDDPSYAGIQWSVKNLFELKNAQRVLIDGNVFERVWPVAQAGFAIQLTPRNQNNTAPWSTVQDVTFTNNIVRYAGNGINMLGQDTRSAVHQPASDAGTNRQQPVPPRRHDPLPGPRRREQRDHPTQHRAPGRQHPHVGRDAGRSGLRVHRQHRPPQRLRRLRQQRRGRKRSAEHLHAGCGLHEQRDCGSLADVGRRHDLDVLELSRQLLPRLTGRGRLPRSRPRQLQAVVGQSVQGQGHGRHGPRRRLRRPRCGAVRNQRASSASTLEPASSVKSDTVPDSVPDTVSDTARNTAPDAGTYILAASGDRHDGTHHFDRRPSIGRDRERRAADQRDGRG